MPRAASSRCLDGHEAGVISAAFARRQAGGDGLFRRTARVWDADSGKLVAVSLDGLDGHAGPVYWAAFSPDAPHVAASSEGRTARVWEADSGKLVARLVGHRTRSTRRIQPRRPPRGDRLFGQDRAGVGGGQRQARGAPVGQRQRSARPLSAPTPAAW